VNERYFNNISAIWFIMGESGGFLGIWPEPIGLASKVCRSLVVDCICSVKGSFGWDLIDDGRECSG